MRTVFKYGLMMLLAASGMKANAQNKALVNTSTSPYAKLSSVDMGDVTWTKGFWADRFKVCRDTMIPNLWRIYTDPKISHAFKNFEIAAGIDTGEHEGPPFHDGDFYKLLEAVSRMYAQTRDPKLNALLEEVIPVIAKGQRADGYIHTPVIISAQKKGQETAFKDPNNFEAYNLGHLMTAACIHYRVTGKKNFLTIAEKATDYLYNFYMSASPEASRSAICPSHYMGVVEMYRTTHNPKYLALAKKLIDIRGTNNNGTDDNQDRIPFRQQTKAIGHAVRGNYLYAGVADIYAETGDTTLMHALNLIWTDMVSHKMYVTGATGALYDGVSPDATSYNPKDIQQVHQAYGRDYQLPNYTAHNETCANIGNVLWNWRMLQVTGKAQYADVMELALYNSVLSGISLSGKEFLYTNPLTVSDDETFTPRWSKDRVGYIKLSNCCPPNVVRTISEISDYAYNISDKGLWFNLYGGNNLSAKLKDGSTVKLSQVTDYPWNGKINVTIQQIKAGNTSLFFRIPGWCKGAALLVNGKPAGIKLISGEYAELTRAWKAGDHVELNLPMPAKLMEANPLVEETRNQVAVKRGPIVYCLESKDLPKGQKIFDVALPVNIALIPQMINIDGSPVMILTGKANLLSEAGWKNTLYKEIGVDKTNAVSIRLIPYYAWGNRGHVDMETWIPVSR